MTTNYQCYKCARCFNQKCHLDNHLNRKRTCQKCNKNFKTNYAYIDGKPIHIKDYIEKKEKKKHKIKCNKGHSLVLVNGTKRRPHFRHKNSGDVGGNPMTEWHINWQSKFPVTEICYPKKEGQIKDRRADILIDEQDYIIEIQHSKIDEANVICRNNDYKLHNKDLIWVIDGNTDDVKLEELSNGQFLIIFNEDWKYKSFSHTYDFILLDIQGNIFKIPVKKVTTTMIKVKEYKSLDIVVSKLQTNPKKVWDLWEDDNSCECELIYWQKGAGNGKTYGMWKKVMQNPDKETFIVLATKHSEKTVILNEIKDQFDRGEYYLDECTEHIEIIPIYGRWGDGDDTPRQYELKYTNKYNNREITVIIATVSSFYFNITEINWNCSEPFKTLIPNFLNEGASKVKKGGKFWFAGCYRFLNKKTQIWQDEAQDLEENHFKACKKLMYCYNVDIGVMGDKLQSLCFEENIFTSIPAKIQNINIDSPPPKNENRRIQVKGLASRINQVVKFDKFGLPKIDENDENLDDVDEPFELMRGLPTTYANDNTKENINKIEIFCDKIVEKFEKEIKENHYLPQDFMIISPILSGRIELIELKSRLEDMWIKRFDDDDYVKNISNDYWKKNNHNYLKKPVLYVQLHRSEDGRAINLTESENKTRIVSNVTSKGDGRNVAFCLNITERILRLVGGNIIGLRYESHLHVPLTRAKRKVYFQLTENGDDIHKRFVKFDNVYFKPEIKNTLQINKLSVYIGDDKIKKMLHTNGVEFKEKEKNLDIKKKVDFTDHCSRYAVWKTLLHFYLNKRLKGHCYKSYEDLKKTPVGRPESARNYWKFLNITRKNLQKLEYIPLINYDNKFYEGFAKNIYKQMKRLQERDYYNNVEVLTECDYLCLSYMINIERYKKWSPFNINNLYSIVDRINKKDTCTQSFYSKIKPVEKICNSMIDNIEKKIWKIELEH